MAQLEVAAFDPIGAFKETMLNLIEITDVFLESDDVPPLDFLRAINHARETFGAIIFILMTTETARSEHKIPAEVKELFDAENTAKELARLESPETKLAYIRKLMSPFMVEFPLDSDGLPPDLFGGDDV